MDSYDRLNRNCPGVDLDWVREMTTADLAGKFSLLAKWHWPTVALSYSTNPMATE